MKITSWLAVWVFGAIFVIIVSKASAEEPTAPPAPYGRGGSEGSELTIDTAKRVTSDE